MSLNNLAADLSALGRREEALSAAAEAVAIRRELAAASPSAFAHDVALSLSVLADQLEALDQLDDALARDEEGVGWIRLYFLANPRAYAQQTRL
jgi:hypothetical protein